jgi:hypothetical protein
MTAVGLCAAAATTAVALAPAAPSAEQGEDSVKLSPSYVTHPPFRIGGSDGKYIRFDAGWSDAPSVWKVCITANYSGNPPVPGGPIVDKCWDTTANTGAKYIDVSCSFYGGVWTSASWYNKSGNRLAYRESDMTLVIC